MKLANRRDPDVWFVLDFGAYLFLVNTGPGVLVFDYSIKAYGNIYLVRFVWARYFTNADICPGGICMNCIICTRSWCMICIACSAYVRGVWFAWSAHVRGVWSSWFAHVSTRGICIMCQTFGLQNISMSAENNLKSRCSVVDYDTWYVWGVKTLCISSYQQHDGRFWLGSGMYCVFSRAIVKNEREWPHNTRCPRYSSIYVLRLLCCASERSKQIASQRNATSIPGTSVCVCARTHPCLASSLTLFRAAVPFWGQRKY